MLQIYNWFSEYITDIDSKSELLNLFLITGGESLFNFFEPNSLDSDKA